MRELAPNCSEQHLATPVCAPAVFGQMSVTAPFLVQKVLKTANSEKFVFSCQTASGVPQPLDSLGFGRKQAPDATCALDSVSSPEKQANSIPPSLSPFATALTP